MKLPDHLYGFQAEDTAALLAAPKRLLLEPMGAGKSVMCVAATEALDAFTIVIICPAVLRTDWQDKFRRWGRNTYTYDAAGFGRRVIAVSFESLNTPARRDAFVKQVGAIDVLILDEAQRLKNPEAQIVASIYGNGADGTGLVALAKHVWIVSGTICQNHWGELWTHLRACFPERLTAVLGRPMTYAEFLDHFCVWEETRWGVRVIGNRAPDVLRYMLKGISIYRDRADVDKLLPRLTTNTVRLPRDTIDAAAYYALMDSADGALFSLAVEDMGERELPNADDPNLARARHAIADLKAAAVAQYVRELLADPDARILLFGHHRSMLRRMAVELVDIEPHIKVIDGFTPQRERDDAVDAFQALNARVLVLGLSTAREGLTLTAANRVVLAEASWTPAHNDQAIHRAYRIGQQRPVFADYVCIADTLDEVVMRVCARKSELLSQVL
jgi:SNF2 family DNA or RNA helicase